MKYDIRDRQRRPDFNNLLKILEGNKPSRPTLFEFFLNDDLYAFLLKKKKLLYSDMNEYFYYRMKAYEVAGYDYITLIGCDLEFKAEHGPSKDTYSLNASNTIHDRKSFNNYNWPKAGDYSYERLNYISKRLPQGMKMIPYGFGGVLENVISLTGYDNLCYMLYDDSQLVWDIFEKVGQTLVDYYKIVSYREDVGAVISNDDWGFNTQTMISYEDMKKYLIPWHKKIVNTIHEAGKPAILHSCGQLKDVMDDIANYIGYDAKHSYEDNILPVEKAYEDYKDKIAVLGGIDLNYLCTKTEDEIYERSLNMVRKSTSGYALGSGNSIPEYVPIENYMAMIAAAYQE